MLVTKTRIDINDVAAFKLVNGDEVIATVISCDTVEYILARPCVVVASGKGVGLIQAMFSLDDGKSVALRHEHIMMKCEAMPQMRDHYLQTTTGIVPVSKGSIIV